MGHTEMLLAVAGLDENSLDERTGKLASGDWATFPTEDRYAFLLARKLSKSPASITARDIQGLIDHFGAERALDVVWWACRCHYMTRVADGFQIPLERENVFIGYFPSPSPSPAPKSGEGKP